MASAPDNPLGAKGRGRAAPLLSKAGTREFLRPAALASSGPGASDAGSSGAAADSRAEPGVPPTLASAHRHCAGDRAVRWLRSALARKSEDALGRQELLLLTRTRARAHTQLF